MVHPSSVLSSSQGVLVEIMVGKAAIQKIEEMGLLLEMVLRGKEG
jgi:hypothetical protein